MIHGELIPIEDSSFKFGESGALLLAADKSFGHEDLRSFFG